MARIVVVGFGAFRIGVHVFEGSSDVSKSPRLDLGEHPRLDLGEQAKCPDSFCNLLSMANNGCAAIVLPRLLGTEGAHKKYVGSLDGHESTPVSRNPIPDTLAARREDV